MCVNNNKHNKQVVSCLLFIHTHVTTWSVRILGYIKAPTFHQLSLGLPPTFPHFIFECLFSSIVLLVAFIALEVFELH